MNVRRMVVTANLAGAVVIGGAGVGHAQCCLNDMFAGFHSCFRKAPPVYAVAPVAAPVMAPVPAPPPPVMVPVQQVSYVPETTYRTEYRSVPVTSYKPSSEIDPCTGCPRDCMEQVTNYVQQPVNVPVTQYRAVYSTKYVQMQPQQGYVQPAYGQPAVGATVPAAVPAPVAGSAWVPGTAVAPGPTAAVASPFAAPVQTTPQAWGAAGADISQQVVPGQTSISAPALPAGSATPTFQSQIVPQSGTYSSPLPQSPALQPTAPPTLAPAPSLRPVTDPRLPAAGQAGAPAAAPAAAGQTGAENGASPAPAAGSAPPPATPANGAAAQAAPRLVPIPLAPAEPGAARGPSAGMPTVPGPGPGTTTGAFPRLIAPTAHTTGWRPQTAPSLPTAALPSRIPQ